jgi:hypothetical protein
MGEGFKFTVCFPDDYTTLPNYVWPVTFSTMDVKCGFLAETLMFKCLFLCRPGPWSVSSHIRQHTVSLLKPPTTLQYFVLFFTREMQFLESVYNHPPHLSPCISLYNFHNIFPSDFQVLFSQFKNFSLFLRLSLFRHVILFNMVGETEQIWSLPFRNSESNEINTGQTKHHLKIW